MRHFVLRRAAAWARGLTLLALCILLSVGAAAEDDGTEPPSEEAVTGPLVAYQAQVMADADPALMEILSQTSQLILLADQPPATLSALKRRADGDLERLQTALRSEGYYDGEVDYRIDQSVRPLMVDLQVVTGTRYRLEAYEIRYTGPLADKSGLPKDLATLGIQPGMPARAPAIVGAEQTLLRNLANTGHPLAKKSDRRALVDHDNSGHGGIAAWGDTATPSGYEDGSGTALVHVASLVTNHWTITPS